MRRWMRGGERWSFGNRVKHISMCITIHILPKNIYFFRCARNNLLRRKGNARGILVFPNPKQRRTKHEKSKALSSRRKQDRPTPKSEHKGTDLSIQRLKHNQERKKKSKLIDHDDETKTDTCIHGHCCLRCPSSRRSFVSCRSWFETRL